MLALPGLQAVEAELISPHYLAYFHPLPVAHVTPQGMLWTPLSIGGRWPRSCASEWLQAHGRNRAWITYFGNALRKFLGFRLDRKKRIGIAPESVERFKTKVREIVGRQTRVAPATNCETTGTGTYEAGGDTTDWPKRETPSSGLEGWIRRHIRKCFWLRWHQLAGRLRRLRQLGVRGADGSGDRVRQPRCLVHGQHPAAEQRAEATRAAPSWLSHAIRSCGCIKPAGFNRRMRKTACPVVWEGHGAQSR